MTHTYLVWRRCPLSSAVCLLFTREGRNAGISYCLLWLQFSVAQKITIPQLISFYNLKCFSGTSSDCRWSHQSPDLLFISLIRVGKIALCANNCQKNGQQLFATLLLLQLVYVFLCDTPSLSGGHVNQMVEGITEQLMLTITIWTGFITWNTEILEYKESQKIQTKATTMAIWVCLLSISLHNNCYWLNATIKHDNFLPILPRKCRPRL